MSKEAIAIKALEVLARLGNGDQYGNSTGNVIARTALFEIAEQPPQPEPPPECQTEAEKKAFAFGWFKAMEAQRLAQPEQVVVYRHKDGDTWFRQYAKDPLPEWAVDVRQESQRKMPTPREVKDVLRSTGLLTNGQSWECAEEVMKLLAAHGIEEKNT